MRTPSENFLGTVLESLQRTGRKVKLTRLTSHSRPPVEHEYYAIIEKKGSAFQSVLPWNYSVLACQEPNQVYGSPDSVLFRTGDEQLRKLIESESQRFKGLKLTPVT